MNKRWRGFGLKTRVVLALAVVILAIQAAYVVLEDRRFVERQSADLQDSADNLSLLYAGAVANAVWEYDREAAKGQLQAMRVIGGFARAVIRESSGLEFVAVDAAADDGSPIPITPGNTVEGRADILVEGRPVGNISVTLSKAPLEIARTTYLHSLLATNGALAIVLLGLTLLVLHLVSRPLDRMTALMQRFSAGNLNSQVPFTDRTDEIGRMARALEVFRGNAIERRLAEEALTRRSEELAILNQDLRKARDVADTANRIKSEFLASMSHEIRTPMNGVIGMVHMLKNTPLNADQQEKLLTLESSARGLLSILNDILDISKIEAGRLDLNMAPFSVADMACVRAIRAPCPIATLASARASTGASLTPSPSISTLRPSACRVSTLASLPSGLAPPVACAMPAASATASTRSGRSPDSSSTRRPRERSDCTASTASGRRVSSNCRARRTSPLQLSSSCADGSSTRAGAAHPAAPRRQRLSNFL